MTKPISMHLQRRYSVLLKKFGDKPFNYEDMYNVPGDKGYWYQTVFHLNKKGWITKTPHYKGVDVKLRPIQQIFMEME